MHHTIVSESAATLFQFGERVGEGAGVGRLEEKGEIWLLLRWIDPVVCYWRRLFRGSALQFPSAKVGLLELGSRCRLVKEISSGDRMEGGRGIEVSAFAV